ncbi:MAG: flagellar type III secretion system pore protein FliP [Planctomycetes bacterium]|nr:flagellar type III secretion system pore protein FliP [Planctomycetota bacterium]
MSAATPRFVRGLLFTLATLLLGSALFAQSPVSAGAPLEMPTVVEAHAPATNDDLSQEAAQLFEEGRMSTAVEIAVLLTVLSLLPAILITVTSFTRIVIVMSFVRRALSTNELPPNPVIIGLSLFLTTFVMGPVASRMYESAWVPYKAGEIALGSAGENAWAELRTFLLANTRESELELFADLAKLEGETRTKDALPLRVVVPAFVTSELKTAFQMGFLLFLPFLVIDLVVASVLLSMGMFMLPPVMVSTPFKLLLFVLVDGWHLMCESLVTSFVTT